LGRFEEALAASYESVKRDPLSWLALANHGHTLLQFGREAEIGPVVERLRVLGKPGAAEGILAAKARVAADRPEAIRHCVLGAEAAGRDACGDTITLSSLGLRHEVARVADDWGVHLEFGEFDQALPLVQQAFPTDTIFFRYPLVIALYRVGRYQEAAALYEEIWKEDAPAGWYETAAMLVNSANAARSAGLASDAQAYRERALKLLASLDRAGVVNLGIRAYGRAMLHAYDGHEDEAARQLIRAIQTHPSVWQWAQWEVLLAKVVSRPEVQAAMREQQAIVQRQRVKVLEMLCGPNPVSKTYRPAAGTCARVPGAATAGS
jgi:tetratricopeptide (TPR) repeat protein